MIRTLFIFILLLASSALQAQLSPGDLHQSHEFLEGVANCTHCHGGDQELVPDNCLACHNRIKESREIGRGLHSRPEYQICQKCHVEHQGRDFTLIYWKNGETAFDHALTGFTLQGKHATLACRQCHRPHFIRELHGGSDEKTDSSRTYLGLVPTCVGCHQDEHRGQLGDNCTQCHDQTAWKPAGGFNHALAKFTLTGKHPTVACIKCHQLMDDQPLGSDLSYQKFTGLPFAQCTACHTDTHKGKLGENCASCHSSESWHLVNTVNFDHSKTRYPLTEKHLAVECGKCHTAGQAKQGLKFGACRDCHADFHKGEFAARPSKGACEECHTVKGFSPASFLMAQHDQTDYPLRGAHRAIPCMACHQSISGSGSTALSFTFVSTRCLACHKDPHRGQVDKLVAASGCELCHAVESWQQVTYDHSKSNFALEGRHVTVACTKCHAEIAAASDRKAVRFTGIRTDCKSCHNDIHGGQFASGNITDCSRCHSPSNWKAPKFDHAVSRFKLDGAHRAVACGKCHPSSPTESGVMVRYKPIDTTCLSCHGNNVPERNG